MQENISETDLSSLFIYFGIRFIYTQRNNSFPGNFSFSWNRKLNLLSENDSIWAANLTQNSAPDLQLYNPTDGICLALTCQAALRGHTQQAAPSLPDGQADHMCGLVRWRSVLWLSFLWSSPRSKFPKILRELQRVSAGETGVNWIDGQNQWISPVGAKKGSRECYRRRTA